VSIGDVIDDVMCDYNVILVMTIFKVVSFGN